MTQQEEQLLGGLIERVNGTQLAAKDADAENMLRGALGPNPDALYILCQTVLVQQFALENAQQQLAAARQQIDAMQQQQPGGEKHGSFLGNLFGLNKDQPPAGYQPVHNPEPYAQQGYPPQGYPQQGYGQPQMPPPGYGAGYPPQGYGYGAPMSGGMFGGGGGFLQGAMQTAAGVVAGEFAFRAIEDMFHSDSRGFGGGEVANNYYEDNSAGQAGGFGDRLGQADGLNGGGISSDIEDRRGDSHGFFGGGDGSNDGSAFADDNSGGNDDSGNFDGGDDSGGFDDGGDSGGGDSGF
jgi:hypothetical protein